MKGERYKNLQELTRVLADNAIFPNSEILGKRKAFAEHVEAFHKDSRISLFMNYTELL